jgi:iron complex transport system permease protein
VRAARRRRLAGLVVAVVVLAVLLAASAALGSKDIPLDRILPALTGAAHGDDALVVTQLRVPRTVTALLAGAALGVAGALIQAFTRNPLADPGILGVNAGAALAVTLGVALLGLSRIGQYLPLALGGAVVATVVVTVVGTLGSGGATPVRMTLSGVGIGAVLGGITSAVTLSDPVTFQRLLSWSAGTVTGPSLGDAAVVAVPIAIGIGIALAISRDLNALALGDDLAVALGGRTALTRALAVVAVTLLAGAATAVAGPIGFVGLMIPHVARWITGPDQRWILAFSVLLGPILLLASDVLGRLVMRPAELPVGVVTAFVGAPVLILLARRAKATAL